MAIVHWIDSFYVCVCARVILWCVWKPSWTVGSGTGGVRHSCFILWCVHVFLSEIIYFNVHLKSRVDGSCGLPSLTCQALWHTSCSTRVTLAKSRHWARVTHIGAATIRVARIRKVWIDGGVRCLTPQFPCSFHCDPQPLSSCCVADPPSSFFTIRTLRVRTLVPTFVNPTWTLSIFCIRT